jgi:hypothetical protein
MVVGVIYALYFLVQRRTVENVDHDGLFIEGKGESRVKRLFRRGLFGRKQKTSFSNEVPEAGEQQVETRGMI